MDKGISLNKKSVSKTGVAVVLFFAAYLIYKYAFLAVTKIRHVEPDRLFAGKVAVLFGTFGVLAGAFFVLGYYFICIKQINPEKVFLLLFPSACLVYAIIFIPGTVPDEGTHFFSAYRFSNYFLFHFEQFKSENVLVRAGDISSLPNAVSNGISSSVYVNFVKNFSFFTTDSTLQEYPKTLCTSAVIAYIFPALGIAIARFLNLSLPFLFYFGRLFNIAVCTIIGYLAIKLTPIGKHFIICFMMLPMSLHLVASFSYDGMINALSALFVAEFLNLYYREKKIGIRDIVLYSVISFLLAPCKLVYVVIVFLPLLLKKDRFEEKLQPKVIWFKFAIVAAGLIGFIVFQIPTLADYGSENISNNYIEWAQSEGFSFPFVLNHPIKTVLIWLETFRQQGDFFITTAIGGNLGWFQVSMPWYAYLPFALILIFQAMRVDNSPLTFSFGQRLYMLLIIVCVTALTLASMFFGWTPITSATVQGLQGRYFLPLMPIAFMIFRNKYITLQNGAENILTTAMLFFSLNYVSEVFLSAFK